MKKYKICDLCIAMNPGIVTARNARPYSVETSDTPDIVLDSTEFFAEKYFYKLDKLSSIYLAESKEFYAKLLNFMGTYIHSSAVVVDDKAYLFSAPSGTGKSTHTSKWLELFGDRAYILNDDKPAIRILEDGIYAYGTPWSGKYDISANKKVKLQGICFLERDTTDWIKPFGGMEAYTQLYSSSSKKISRDELLKQIQIFDIIVKNISIWKMGCTPTTNAAKVAYEAMSGEKFTD